MSPYKHPRQLQTLTRNCTDRSTGASSTIYPANSVDTGIRITEIIISPSMVHDHAGTPKARRVYTINYVTYKMAV